MHFIGRISFIIFLLLSIVPFASYAGQKLWPTDLLNYGDCNSARIFAPTNEEQGRVASLRCSKNNSDDLKKIQTCIENSKYKSEVVFFNDLCDSGDAFISLNGVEYKLQRVTSPSTGPVSFEGSFEGEGIKVTIDVGKPITEEISESDAEGNSELTEIRFEVFVTVLKDGFSERINGVFYQETVKSIDY